ncbi:MAG: hypothetical protein GQ574_22110 [Crocinitomix sp.]|nr:hypothetical protein [Crocinitomix sp.]
MHALKKILNPTTRLTFTGLLVLVVSVSLSCNGNKDKGRVIAQVGEHELYETDVQFLAYTQLDSAAVVSHYVEEWVAEQILVSEAEKDENVDMQAIDRRIEEFRNDLLIHQLEDKRIEVQLDTTVSTTEIEAYYKDHQADFQLNDYLVKVLYLKIPLDAPDIDKIGGAYKLRNDEDIETIETYAKMYASNFYYDIESWIYFDDILKEIPLHDINKDRFILKRSKIRFEETGFYYFLNIVDYKLKNSTSPISFERENIKARIINLRIKDLRQTIKNDIIKKAYDNGKVTIY